jgi:hypothetical protein
MSCTYLLLLRRILYPTLTVTSLRCLGPTCRSGQSVREPIARPHVHEPLQNPRQANIQYNAVPALTSRLSLSLASDFDKLCPPLLHLRFPSLELLIQSSTVRWYKLYREARDQRLLGLHAFVLDGVIDYCVLVPVSLPTCIKCCGSKSLLTRFSDQERKAAVARTAFALTNCRDGELHGPVIFRSFRQHVQFLQNRLFLAEGVQLRFVRNFVRPG